ncbi:hypothetical protein [Methylobacterium sp. 285MFTsu5.1]|uniref:hypothetical protein n=1 Tax=Methylobacterium sp. 285MFTsu5.1 TaxID=1172187 RepID=UPI00131A1B2B|nr:hypothetical protein [Methylobacterium sp. 285MFTsu5.1]
MDDRQDEATLKALGAVAGPAFIAKESPYFTSEEAEALKAEAQTLWSHGHWLHALLQDHGELLRDPSTDVPAPTFSKLDEALAAVIVSAYRIGAASFVHPANKRHLKSAEMQDRRKAKALSPKQIKRERIKNTVLPALLAKGLRRHELLTELNRALAAEGATPISQETADRWRKEQASTAVPVKKPLTE